jgi:DNA replication regulator DPB11
LTLCCAWQPNTRQGSDASVNTNVIEKPSSVTGVTTRSRALPPIALGGGAITGDLFGSYNAADEFENEEGGKLPEESMRVMYEDPGQRDEKKRLLNLLKNQAGGGEEDSLGSSSGGFGKRTRRSMRIAGF